MPTYNGFWMTTTQVTTPDPPAQTPADTPTVQVMADAQPVTTVVITGNTK